MATRRIFQGKANLNKFWRMLLDEAAHAHPSETERRQAWFAGVKYDYFTSDAGQALIDEIGDTFNSKGEYPPIMFLCRLAWREYHIRQGITF